MNWAKTKIENFLFGLLIIIALMMNFIYAISYIWLVSLFDPIKLI